MLDKIVCGEHVNTEKNDVDFSRHVIPKRSHYCFYCGALMWLGEKLSSSTTTIIKFGTCCLQGTIYIPLTKQIPDVLFKLLTEVNVESKNFRTAIRLNNSILSFTSIAANVDQELLTAKKGVYNLRINGTINHKISSLLPKQNYNPFLKFTYMTN